MMKRLTLTAMAALIAAACSGPTTPVAQVAARGIGPNGGASHTTTVSSNALDTNCLRTTGKPKAQTFTFTAIDGTATLTVTGNGVQGLNGTLRLNGKTIVSHDALAGEGDDHHGDAEHGDHHDGEDDDHRPPPGPLTLVDTIPTIAGLNTLVCKLEGKPGSGIHIVVTQL